ncbi:hypothetical protein lerEdw1_010052 [Lerista edwardsae]|nr:hypothetical protein lerEdw1_010052 [Lerista edwardsae]
MATFTEKDFYAQHFSPKDYMEAFYSFRPEKEAENAFLRFRLKSLHEAFALDGVEGGTLIDIGSGPSIYQLLSACEAFREIVATDYADQNREEMQRWLRKEPGTFDWSPVVKHVCELEGDSLRRSEDHEMEVEGWPCPTDPQFSRREKWAEKEEKLRRTIKRVLKCDVTLPNPLAPVVLPPADCLLSTLCLEVACKDLPTFSSALKNIGSLLKPGGHLVMLTILEDSFYMVGQRRFSALFLERKFLEDAVAQAGFEIKWIKETQFSVPLPMSDAKGVCATI